MSKHYFLKILSLFLVLSFFNKNIACAVDELNSTSIQNNVKTQQQNKDKVKPKQQKATMQKTFGMIKPSGMKHASEIKNIIASYGLKIIKSKKVIMTEKQFNQLYVMHKGKPFYEDLKNSLLNKEVEVMIIYGKEAVEKYRNYAIKDIRDSRRGYVINKTENAVHGADTPKRAREEMRIFFDR